MGSQAEIKAEYATRLMHVALQVAAAAPSDRQQRILARYVLLEADSAARWLGQWQEDLADSTATRDVARAAKRSLRTFRREYAKQKEIRDRLVARRQAAESGRAADLRRTVELWRRMTRIGAERLCKCARAACIALGSTADLAAAVDPARLDQVRVALLKTRLDPDAVYTDATSYAIGEQNLLAATVTGPLGRRVAQINDVHDQLDLLFGLHELAEEVDLVGLLLRSALVVEIDTIIDRTIGPPPGVPRNRRDGVPLISLLDRGRGETGFDLLSQFRDEVVPVPSRVNLRDLRNRVAAHLDTQLTLGEICDTLEDLDVAALFRFADVTLDWLDAVARSHVDLGLLVIGHRQLSSLQPTGASVRAPFKAAQVVDILDSPFGSIVGGGFGARGTGGMMGVVSGRARRPRVSWLSGSTEGLSA
ncbi:MAG TPA: hypothetical protein VFT19_13530 [Solirubrobacterales bacterium]|nr:hypothetical protein [Solirubrobacterales bacterium]